QGRSENPQHPEPGQPNFSRPPSHLRQRRLGARLLSQVQQPPPRIFAGMVERSELGRNQQALPIVNQEIARVKEVARVGTGLRPVQPSAARQLAARTLPSTSLVQNVQVRRSGQKLSATFPRSAISRIKHPISLGGKKFSQRLFARNRRHPIAQNNRPLPLSSSSRRQEFRDDVAHESCPEHKVSLPFCDL